MSVRWAALALGILALGLHVQSLSGIRESLTNSTSGLWYPLTEGLLLLWVLALVLISGVIERRRAALERKLDQLGDCFRQFSQCTEDVFWLLDANTKRVLYLSPSCEVLWGYACEEGGEFPGSWLDKIVPEDRDWVAEELRSPRSDQDIEYQILDPAGRRHWVRHRSFPVRNADGDIDRQAILMSDITAQKSLYARLVQRGRFLNMASCMTGLGGWSIDLELGQLSLSEEACALFDLPGERHMSLDQALQFHPPKSRKVLSEAMDSSVAHGQPYDVEVQLTSASGRYLWVRVQGHPVRDERGKITRLEGAIQDVTDRKHSTNLLAQGMQRFRNFANAMPNLVWTADSKGRLDYGNQALEAFLGDEEGSAVLDERWRAAIDAGAKPQYEAAWAEALNQEGHFQIECPLGRADGEQRWHAIEATPVRDTHGEVIKWYGNGIDIHERKLSERKAQDLAERLAATLESITDAFFTLDNDWRFTYVNREAERLLQQNRGDLLYRNLWECFDDLLGTDFEDYYRKAAATGEKVAFDTFFDSENRWFTVHIYPSRQGLSVYFQDITARKRSEREQARIRELENSREVAEMANETKSKFLASMTHEVRTPINGIVGMVEILRQTSLGEHQVEMVDIIHESSEALLGIVDDILDFSKIEAGRMELHTIWFSPRALLRSVCLLLDRMARNHDVELTLYADPDLPETIEGDDLRLRQILLNLVSNAIKFSSNLEERGRVRVEALRVNRPGAEGTRGQRTAEIEWRVLDNGIGMTSETLSRLFSPFVQADASTTRQYGGTGLGLSITHNLVELMSGDIKVTSAPGKGTEFRVRLTAPIVHEAEEKKRSLAGACVVIWQGQNQLAGYRETGLSDVWSAYVKAAGAEVYSPEIFSEHERLPASPCLIVYDSGEANPGESELWAQVPEQTHESLTWLVVGRGDRRKVRRESARIFRIDANSLSESTFIQTVAVALNRAPMDEGESSPMDLSREVRPPSREKALAEGRLILVAEDNDTNRRVISRQLTLLGYAADLAANGREALQRWKQSPEAYAAILTDLHMPEMDGYGLIEAVRQEEQQEWGSRSIPVIALTANALKREQHWRTLGMNDYLVKPASLDSLKAVLARWCPPKTPGDQFPEPETLEKANSGAGSVSMSSPTLDLQVLRSLIGGDEEILVEFVQSFWASAHQLVQQLRKSAQQQDWPAAAAAAHSLKSSARTAGASTLGECCMELEAAAQAQGEAAHSNLEHIHLALNAVDEQWREVENALKATNIKSPL